MATQLRDLVRDKWGGILPALGVSSAYMTGKHGPCPICGGKDRFRFDNKDGAGTYYCSQCGAGDGFALLMAVNKWDFKEAASQVKAIVGNVDPTKSKPLRSADETRKAMNAVWNSSSPVTLDDVGGKYLFGRTRITAFPRCLRFHPRLRYHDDTPSYHPALVAKLTAPDGKPAILHRTYLSPESGKADVDAPRRIMQGTIPKGSAVRLAPYVDTLGIAEGIETAFAAFQLFGVPCWAATNAELLANWIPPEDVRSIVIFGDNDDSFTGHAVAYGLARRLRSKRLDVRVEIPPSLGDDWDDVFLNNMELAA